MPIYSDICRFKKNTYLLAFEIYIQNTYTSVISLLFLFHLFARYRNDKKYRWFMRKTSSFIGISAIWLRINEVTIKFKFNRPINL